MRERILVSVLGLLAGIAWHSPAAAQYGHPVPLDVPGKSSPRGLLAPKVSPELKTSNGSTGSWGGRGCASATAMKALVDNYLATPGADYPELGSPVPGASVSWYSPQCGTFTYAAGLANIERGSALTPTALMSIGSMTKPVIAAVTLRLYEAGTFGPLGLDTPVSKLLTAAQIRSLTVGDNAGHPRCPGQTVLYNRQSQNFELTTYSCPDLTQVTLRNLMISNHGMYDFVNEVLLPDGSDPIADSLYFKAYQALGLKPQPPPNSTSGFDQLKAYGLKRNDQAVIGGTQGTDFELSFGNTGFQLLGVILEQRTGKSLDQLIKSWVTGPLGIEDMPRYLKASSYLNIANDYDMYGDEPSDPVLQSKVYPLAKFHGYKALNILSLGQGLPANINFAGGAGSLTATPRSYALFFRALMEGGLLGPQAQSALNNSFVVTGAFGFGNFPPGAPLYNGFGVQWFPVVGPYNTLGTPDFDIFLHVGNLPGLRCFNADVRPVDPLNAPAGGALCLNANRLVDPDPFLFWMSFVELVVSGGP
jgi:CubicO group peptidase (beta-lactamase class C family)